MQVFIGGSSKVLLVPFGCHISLGSSRDCSDVRDQGETKNANMGPENKQHPLVFVHQACCKG